MSNNTGPHLFATSMRESIRKGEVEEVNTLLGRGFDPKHLNSNGSTFLHFACQYDSAAICRILLEAGVDIEARNDKSQTALTIAIEFDNREVFHALLDAGANVHAPGEADWNPLHFAIQSARSNENSTELHSGECIRELVARGADIASFESTEKEDPLQMAVECTNLAGVRGLMACGYEEHLGLDAVRRARDSAHSMTGGVSEQIASFLNSWVSSREAQLAIDGICPTSIGPQPG